MHWQGDEGILLAVTMVGDRKVSTMPENKAELGKIIAKAWRDPAFKAELIANSAIAVLTEGVAIQTSV